MGHIIGFSSRGNPPIGTDPLLLFLARIMAYIRCMTTTVSIPSLGRIAAAAIRGLGLTLVALVMILPDAGRPAERGQVEAFLKTTGFDVALDSIALSAGDAPRMLGIDAGAFGSEWTRLTKEVFDTGTMREMALDVLEKALDPADLAHAVAFYASDLGQRLVAAENASHMMEDDAAKQEEGRRLVAEMVRTGSGRLELLKRIKKQPPPLPVCMMTAYGSPQYEQAAVAQGCEGYLTKPIDFKALKQRIQSLAAPE